MTVGAMFARTYRSHDYTLTYLVVTPFCKNPVGLLHAPPDMPDHRGRPTLDELLLRLATVRANSRTISAELQRRLRKHRRHSRQAHCFLSHADLMVVQAIMLRSSAPRLAAHSYILHNTTACSDVSDQPRSHLVLERLQPILEDQESAEHTFPDGPYLWSLAAQGAWCQAGRHLAELELSQYTVHCNMHQRFAPSTALLRAKWREICDRWQLPAAASATPASLQRKCRRGFSRWRKRWGFRFGKMRLRDHYSEGELLGKVRAQKRVRHSRNNICPN